MGYEHPGTTAVGPGTTLARWFYTLADPNTLFAVSDEAIVAHGDSGDIPGVQVGPPNAPFYPPVP